MKKKKIEKSIESLEKQIEKHNEKLKEEIGEMKQKKIILGMSGGVDSSVAALLLKRKGYEVYGYFMNCGMQKKRFWPSGIDWKEDEKMLRDICKKLEVKLIMADCEVGYENKIIKPMIEEYKMGLTPNPDILCNTIGKFPNLIKTADETDAAFIATGHYARLKKAREGYNLLQGKDKKKDQSYFLCGLSREILSRTLFPLGELTKEKVREIAKKAGFKNWSKKSSRGVCYLGKIDFKKFLRGRIDEKGGEVLDESGLVIGHHPGIAFFTVGEKLGERKGVVLNKAGRKRFSGKRLFVAKKEKDNRLIAASEGNKILYRKKVLIKGLNLINPNEKVRRNLKARIRHLGEFHAGELFKKDGEWLFEFKKEVESVAEGQWIVFYDGEKVIGGGEMRFE